MVSSESVTRTPTAVDDHAASHGASTRPAGVTIAGGHSDQAAATGRTERRPPGPGHTVTTDKPEFSLSHHQIQV